MWRSTIPTTAPRRIGARTTVLSGPLLRVFGLLTVLSALLFLLSRAFSKSEDVAQSAPSQQQQQGNGVGEQYATCTPLDKIEEVHTNNRKVHNAIDSWIRDEDYNSSVFLYGMPKHVAHLSTKDVGEPVNLSDLVGFLATKFGPGTNYLEMGVSVGKTLYQVLHTVCDSNVVAFDLETINPTFHRLLESKMNLVLKGGEASLTGHSFLQEKYVSKKPDDCHVRRYDGVFRGNTFGYVDCDEFDLVGWRGIKDLVTSLGRGATFQVIFSDALHSVQAIRFELDRIMDLELLDRQEFAYIWDDMGQRVPPLCERVVEYADINVRHKISCVVAKIPGWFGVNEKPHNIAIITTLNIDDLVRKHMQSATYVRAPQSSR